MLRCISARGSLQLPDIEGLAADMGMGGPRPRMGVGMDPAMAMRMQHQQQQQAMMQQQQVGPSTMLILWVPA